MAGRGRTLGVAEGAAASWLASATSNLARIRRGRADACAQIEHYTDVIAEATVASAFATAAQGLDHAALATRADNLAHEATQAQRQAVQVCRRSALKKVR